MTICRDWQLIFCIYMNLVLDYDVVHAELTTTKTPTTTPAPTTIPVPMLVTTVPIPDGGCYVNGNFYENGQWIQKDKCSGTLCSHGEIVYWDAWCMFYSSTPTTSTPPRTTTPLLPTTTPRVPPGGCLYNNQVLLNGESIMTSPDKCHKVTCNGGMLSDWYDWCYYSTHSCNGWWEQVPGQCCPICHPVSHPTTTPTTTTTRKPPLPDCWYHGKIYRNYDIFDTDANGCYGYECHYGVVRSWKKPCFNVDSECSGVLVNVTGECCPVCRDTTTTTTSTTAETTTTSGCIIKNTVYLIDSRTNSDPCNKCYCTIKGEVCTRTICEDVTDCTYKYRLKGDCCFTCGAAGGLRHSFHIMLLLVLVPVVG